MTAAATLFHVLLAFRDDAIAVAAGARLLREAQGSIRATASTLHHLPDAAARLAPDFVLLEYVPRIAAACVDAVERVALASPRTHVLVLWERYSAPALSALVNHGASGCLLVSSPPASWLKAMACVRSGQAWFGRSELVDALRTEMRSRPRATSQPTPPEGPDLLTPREREIMILVGAGMTNKEIARRLAISGHTVKTHLHHVYVKLESSGRYKAFVSGSQDTNARGVPA